MSVVYLCVVRHHYLQFFKMLTIDKNIFLTNLWLTRQYCDIQKVHTEKNSTSIFRSINPQINGRNIFKFNLSDYRGKYVLLEFWASWCVPCRAENPDLLIAYKKYQEKGFVVVGISLDDKKDRWEKAIEEDKLPWIHVSDLNAFDNKLAKLYGVQPIPDNFLIDPQGKIIARQLRGKEVQERLASEIR